MTTYKRTDPSLNHAHAITDGWFMDASIISSSLACREAVSAVPGRYSWTGSFLGGSRLKVVFSTGEPFLHCFQGLRTVKKIGSREPPDGHRQPVIVPFNPFEGNPLERVREKR